MNKSINVVAAIIIHNHRVLSCKRSYGEQKGGWEFPGGKIEKDESPEEALTREIKEELSTDITVESHFMNIEYDYEKFHLHMECYICSANESPITLNEHEDFKWLSKDELSSVNWLEADRLILDELSRVL